MVIKKKCGTVLTALFVTLVLGTTLFTVANASASQSSPAVKRATTFVGGEIHSLTSTKNGLFLTGHGAGSYSNNEGVEWRKIASIDGADIMGWATTNLGYLAGGHNGLYRSTNGGKSFTLFTFYGKARDVHSLGGTKKYVYLGSPQVGFLRSVDSGKSWKVVNQKFGQGLMGSMLVDPKNPLRVIAPDMQNGLVESTDGGKTWRRFGGPGGAMSVSWNPKNPKEIIALGMGVGALTKDDGKNWITFSVPAGSSAIAFSSTGSRIFLGTLVGDRASILVSTDDGKHWS